MYFYYLLTYVYYYKYLLEKKWKMKSFNHHLNKIKKMR